MEKKKRRPQKLAFWIALLTSALVAVAQLLRALADLIRTITHP